MDDRVAEFRRLAAAFSAAADEIEHGEHYRAELEALRHERDEAVRHEGMFRRALHKHLMDEQQLGVTSPETLAWIEAIVRGGDEPPVLVRE